MRAIQATSGNEYLQEENLVAAAAGEIRDLLNGLVKKIATDSRAAFEPDVLERLAELKKADQPKFEALRAQLKEAGCQVAVLDDAIAEECGRQHGSADILIRLAQSYDLFHTANGTAYADLEIDGHRETLKIRSKAFRRRLAHQFFNETGGAPRSEALNSALNVIEAHAQFDSPEREVYVRVAKLDGRIYVDLCDEKRRVVQIDAAGWRLDDNPPVRFIRTPGMRPLPPPVPGGSIDALRPFLNLQSDSDFLLAFMWAVNALRTCGPYPVLVVNGEQGTAKSTFVRILLALLDPHKPALRTLPRNERDLFITASNAHVLAFDNVSVLAPWLSDVFCQLSTGGGFAARQLYSDADEVLFDATRPLVLNGIESFVTRPDLADRALFLTLEPIDDVRRRTEEELWATFEAQRPRILGVLFDVLAEGIKRLPETRLDNPPRMADFARFATACETKLWPAGTFSLAYRGNRDEVVDAVIEADQVATAVRAMMMTMTKDHMWAGTATQLLSALSRFTDRAAKSKDWPEQPNALSNRIRRAATFLRKAGIDIAFHRKGGMRHRIITIRNVGISAQDSGGEESSASFASMRLLRTVFENADGAAKDAAPPIVLVNPLKADVENDADGADAESQDPDAYAWRQEI